MASDEDRLSRLLRLRDGLKVDVERLNEGSEEAGGELEAKRLRYMLVKAAVELLGLREKTASSHEGSGAKKSGPATDEKEGDSTQAPADRGRKKIVVVVKTVRWSSRSRTGGGLMTMTTATGKKMV
jgi:hypothetical protein